MSATYKRTTIGCFVGIFTQAVITNLTAILFVPMMDLYGFRYEHLGILVAVNFISQVMADISFSRVIDKVGYRKVVLPTCIAAALGLVLFAVSPYIFPGNVFVGIVIATFIFAFSSGLLEIMLSPIVAAIPGNDKGPAMSLMHSFYAWGQVATIIITTLLVFFVDDHYWPLIVLMWTVVPVAAFLIFVRAPMPDIVPAEHRQGMRALMVKPVYIVALFAIFFGAGAEVSMNQWSSTFMEKGLELPKLAGDLIGMCGYAVMLGLGRTLYGIFGSKIDITKVLIGGSLLSVVCYLVVSLSPITSVAMVACILCGIGTSLLWPGTIVIASDTFPMAGAWMFAILAAAGDIGAGFAPWITGKAADGLAGSGLVEKFAQWLNVSPEQGSLRFGVLLATVFSVLALVSHILLRYFRNREKTAQKSLIGG